MTTNRPAASNCTTQSSGQTIASRNCVDQIWRFPSATSRCGRVRARRIPSFVAAVMLLFVSSIAAKAQVTLLPSWNQLSPATSPSARYIDAMAYDSTHSQVVLFGGNDGSALNDTWLWNGTTWAQASPATVPPARNAPTMAYDPVHGQVVMFGGLGNQFRLNDTWLWDGTNWTQANPTNNPPIRQNASMVYDAVTGQILLFGGISTGSNYVNDTWAWNGTNWTLLSPSSSPPARAGASIAYDASTSQVVLFGGSGNSGDLNDTWVWNGTNWIQQYPANSPSARDAAGMDYDLATSQVVLFGGQNGSASFNDTWLWNGSTWTQDSLAVSPSARSIETGMIYDTASAQMLLFGGYNNGDLGDTWSFAPSGNFGNVNVCPQGATTPAPCSSTLTLTYNVATTVTFAATEVLTQGAALLDFKLASSTCEGQVSAGSTCTVNLTFTPLAPGCRMGAVLLSNNTAQFVSTPVYGIGQGPAAAVAPGSPTVVATGFTNPNGAAVDALGNLYVTDFGAGTVQQIAPNGTSTPLGVTFTEPTGVAVDGLGDVFVADEGAGKIVEIPLSCLPSSCQSYLAVPAGITKESGVAVDGAGNIYFTSLSPAQLTEIPAGCTTASCAKVLWTGPAGPGISQPDGVAVDAAGDIFIADGGGPAQVTEIPAGCTSTACQITVGTSFEAPTGVAVDAAGDVFVSDANLGVFEVPVGCTSFSCQTAVFAGGAPFGVAIDGLGDIFVPSSTSKTVTEVVRSGTVALNFASTPADGHHTVTASVTLQNVGNQTLQPESPGLLNVSGASFANTEGPGTPTDCSATNTLASGAQCNVSILFTPQSYTQPNTGSALFSDNSLNDPNAFQAVSLYGLGTAPAQSSYAVTVALVGSGSGNVTDLSGAINCVESAGTLSGTCAANFPVGTQVILIPTAAANSTFQGWGGACASSGTSASCPVVVTQTTVVEADFATQVTSYPLTVTTSGTGPGIVTDNLGEISCSAANGVTTGLCSGPYPSGTFVLLTATSSGGSIFAGWGGACASSGASATCIVTITSAENVNASFIAPGASSGGTLKPITAGVVYGQGGSFTSNSHGNNANSLFDPDGIAIDSGGNVYVSDQQNGRVLFYPFGTTTPTRIYGQVGGISANSLSGPYGIALDSGSNLYVADYGNNRVLFYPSGSTTATRVYGQGGSFTSNTRNNGGISANSLYLPTAVALDSGGNLYVTDQYNNRVLFYPAGSTTATRVYGQGGSFTTGSVNNGGINANTLAYPSGLVVDSSGDLYVADGNNSRVLFYPTNSTTATRVYGQGGSFTSNLANNGGTTANSLAFPAGLVLDSGGNLYVADGNNYRVLFYPFGSTTATRVYGQSGSFTANTLNNGGVSANSFSQTWALALDSSGDLYVTDLGNNRVLEYGSFGNINACQVNQSTPAPCSNTVTYSYSSTTSSTIGAAQVLTQGATGLDFTFGSGTCTGAGTYCTLNVNFAPLAPGLRTGSVALFDGAGNPLASALISGVGQAPELSFGPGVETALPFTGLSYPVGVAVDASGNTFFADYTTGKVVKLTPSGVQTTVPTTGLTAPIGVAVDGAGNVYITDFYFPSVVKVAPGGVQTTLGSGLNYAVGIALDAAGDVFVGDQNNNRVVKITPSGIQTTVPVTGLNQPWGVAVDAQGDLFVADGTNSRVVEVSAGGVQTTVAATGLSQPYGVAVDAAGDVYIADPLNTRVVEVPAGGGPQTTVGTGLNYPSGVTVDGVGNVVIGDQGSSQVYKVNRSQVPSLTFAQTNVGSTSTDSPQTIVLQNIGNQTLTGTGAVNLGGNFTLSSTVNCTSTLTLTPGATCGQNFSFTPQSATFLSGSDVFTDNNLNGSPAIQTITLGGTGATAGVAGLATVPNVVGQAQAAATAPITVAGLAMGTVSTASSQTVLAGNVISQSPAAGTQVAVGSAVNILVSTGLPQPPPPNPLSLNNNYFLTGDYVSAGVTLRGTGVGGLATGSITIPNYTQSTTLGVPDGADIIDALLYWETVESTPSASSMNGTFNNYPIVGQQIGNDIPNYVDGHFTGTIRSYRANVNVYLPVSANGLRFASGTYKVSLPDSGGTGLPLTEGASLVFVYRVLSPNFPLKSVVIYDGSALPTAPGVQPVIGFYDAVGGASGTGKNTNIFASGGIWNNSLNASATLGQSNSFNAPLNSGAAYAAVIVSTPVNNSDNDGILDAWKAGPASGDFHAGQPGYYDAKTATWVGLPGAKHGQKDLFVQLDYMCGAVLSNGSCDTTKENLFPAPDASGNDPLAMVQQAFANSGVQMHLQVGNAVPEDTCIDGSSSQLCQFPGQSGVVGWKNSLEFSKLYPRNLVSCLTGGDCTTRFPFGQKDSYHYVLMGHSLAIPAWNTRYGTLTSISVVNNVTTIGTVDRGTGINACPSRVTIGGVLGNTALNGVYNTTGCADSKTITIATPGVPNYTYPNNILPEPVIGLTSGTISSISGYSDLGGADSAVTLGLWLTAPNQDMSKKATVVAGTIFHEIGHTLGLSHGGLYYDTNNSYVPTFDANCKPNYQSVMNYLFQLDGLGPNQTIAFSNQTLATLNENAAASVTQLIDGFGNAATFPTSSWYVPYTSGSPVSPATLHCDGTPLNGESGYRVNGSIAPITPAWTNSEDLSFIGALQSNERGFNDLTNMDLRQVGATGGEFASLASTLSFGSSVTPLNISSGGNVTLGSGGTVALGSGGTVTLGSGGNVTLGSGGTVTLGSGGNVTLGSGGNVTLGSGGTITPGSSGTVTLGSGGNVTLGSGGTITLGSGGTVTLGSGGNVTLGSGGNVTLGSGGTLIPVIAGGTVTLGSGGTVTLGSGGNVTLGSGGNVTLGSGGTITLGSGGNVTLGSGGNVTLGSGGTITLGSGGNVTLGSGGNVTLGSGGTITLGSGGTVTLGSGGNVTLGSGGTVTLGSGGNVALGSGGNVTLGSGGVATLGAGGTVTLGSGGNVTLGSGGNVTLGSGGTIALGSGGNVTLGSGGSVTLGSGGNVTLGSGGNITLGSGGTVTLGSGGTITLGSGGVPQPVSAGTYLLSSGGNVTLGSGGTVVLGSGGNITLGSGGTISFGSGGNVTLGSGGNVTLGSGGTITLGSGGTVTLGSGGNITLGSGGVVTLGNGGSVNLGTGSDIPLASTSNITPASGGPAAANELTYETANSVVRPPALPVETPVSTGVRVTWTAPAFGVVQTYTIYRSSNGATPIVIGSVSGVNGNPPATEFTDTNPDLVSQTVVYTVTTTLVPDTAGPSRQSVFSPPAVLKNDQSITLGPLPSSVVITNPPTVTATAMSGGVANGLQVVFSATGSCAIGGQSVANGVSSAAIALTSTGSCTVIASQPGTTAFNAANSVSGTFMVLPQGSAIKSQTINFPLLPSTQYGNSFSLSASSSSGQAVSFTSTGPCTPAGVISGVGVCSITASAPANSSYSAASLTQSFNIYPAVLKVTATNLASAYGQALPALTYSYAGFVNNDTAAVVSGAPALSTTATSTSAPGSYPITVSTGTLATPNYSFLYVTGSLTIQSATQSALVLNATSPLTYGQSETLSVSGGSTGGTVTYNLVSGTCGLTGAKLTANSGTGACQVTATMVGNSAYNSVTSSPVNVTLATAAQTIAFTTNPPTSAAYNSTFNVAATGGASSNAVTFTNAGVCTNTGANYKMTSGTGSCSVIANQAGNSNYAAATQVTKTVNATLAAPTVTFTGAPTTAADNSHFTVASTTNASTTAVITSSGACSNSGTAITMTSGTGTCSLTATWAADANYAGTTAGQSTAATKLAPTVTFTGAPSAAPYNSKFTVATTTNASVVAVITSSGACSNAGTTVTMTSGTGNCLLTATWAADNNYSGITASQSTAATTLPQTITFTTSPPASAAYASTFTVAATGGASGNPVTYSSAGVCTNSGAVYTMTNGTGNCSVIASQAGNSNYAATMLTKTVTAIGPLLSVSPSSINFGTVYYGSISAQGITVTNTGTAPATITDPILSIVKGGNSNEFVAVNLCPKPLAAGKSCLIAIAFLAGPYYTPQTATLQVMSNAPGSPLPVALSALVINPQASFNPSSLSFGTIKHATSSTLNVTLSNPGGTALTLNGISITGANATSFVQSNACGTSLAAGSSCIIAVKFTPPAVGTFSANLTVVDNSQTGGGTQSVPLSGKGN